MYSVIHDEKQCKFFMKISKKPDSEGVLLYEKIGSNHYDFYHTEVPKEYRGRGLAGKLAREAFNHIIAEKATVTLSCTYLQKFCDEELSSAERRQHVVGAGGL